MAEVTEQSLADAAESVMDCLGRIRDPDWRSATVTVMRLLRGDRLAAEFERCDQAAQAAVVNWAQAVGPALHWAVTLMLLAVARATGDEQRSEALRDAFHLILSDGKAVGVLMEIAVLTERLVEPAIKEAQRLDSGKPGTGPQNSGGGTDPA
jgi:hypothetical protein